MRAPVNRDSPCRRAVEAEYQVEQRCLACAGGADYAEKLTLGDGESDFAEDQVGAKRSVDLLEADGVGSHRYLRLPEGTDLSASPLPPSATVMVSTFSTIMPM